MILIQIYTMKRYIYQDLFVKKYRVSHHIADLSQLKANLQQFSFEKLHS